MEIKGRLIKKEEVRVITEKFKNLKFVVETSGEYPQTIQMELQNANTSKLDSISVGDEVKCSIDIRGRKWINTEGMDVYFNTIVCWKIESNKGSLVDKLTGDDENNLPF